VKNRMNEHGVGQLESVGYIRDLLNDFEWSNESRFEFARREALKLDVLS
jgi:hypothetical protein